MGTTMSNQRNTRVVTAAGNENREYMVSVAASKRMAAANTPPNASTVLGGNPA